MAPFFLAEQIFEGLALYTSMAYRPVMIKACALSRRILLLLPLLIAGSPALAENSKLMDSVADVSSVQRVAFTDLPHGWPIQILPVGNQVLLSNGETFRGLQRIDWRNPENPRLAQSFDTGNTNGSLVKLGSRIYQLANYYGITIFDMADDDTLKRSGHWRMQPPVDHGRRMVGMLKNKRHYLYLHIKPEGNWKDWPKQPASPEPGMYMLDVSDVQHVQVHYLGRHPMFSCIKDSYGFVLSGPSLKIYSLKKPETPLLIGSYQAGGKIRGISVDGTHAWLVIGGHSVAMLDISDPGLPQLLSRSDAGKMRRATSIAAHGAWAYVLETGNHLSGPDGGLHVFHQQGEILQHVMHRKWPHTNMQSITLVNNAAYVTDGYYGVHRLDLSQPDKPEAGALFISAGEVQQLLLDGNLAIANLEWGGMVAIMDVSDPLHIRKLGYYRPGRFDDYAIALHKGYFYYGKGRKRKIVDLHQPERPTEVGEWSVPGKPLMPPVKSGNHMFQWVSSARSTTTLLAYNMSNPLHPELLAQISMPAGFPAHFGSSVTDGKTLFAVSNNGIAAIDISDMKAMKLIGSHIEKGIGARAWYSWQGAGRRMALYGEYLYIIQGSERLDMPRIVVIDASDPAHMRKVFITPETPPAFQDDWFDSRLLHQGDMLNDMTVHNDTLYVSDYWGGLRAYDLNEPFRPALTAWEFAPYLELMPKDWSRTRYSEAMTSGDMHKALQLDAQKWDKRRAIGRAIWNRELVHHPGYELYGWNVGGFVDNYLLQPKLGGIAVYHFPDKSSKR